MSRPDLLLDITRLLRRARHATPTGIDRVEMAYARYLARHAAERLVYTAFHPGGWHVRLPAAAAARFLQETTRRWRGEPAQARRSAAALWARLCLTAPAAPAAVGARPAAYLLLSHTNLERPAAVARAIAAERARLVCLVHDLIPLTHPQFARAGSERLHRTRLGTVEALADLVVCNSQATARAIGAALGRGARQARIVAAPLGVALDWQDTQASARAAGTLDTAGTGAAQPPAAAPYFVMLGTIEPRKNHMLMLLAWQRLVEQCGAAGAPRLKLIGRSGWDNAHVLGLLERTPALRGVVSLSGRAGDREVAALLRGARALLMPSFAEGFGLPVAEALALGVPVIASDLPALREAGGAAPEYLDPLDGPAWLRAVRDYAPPHAPRRAAQLARIAAWRAPSWEAHCGTVLAAIDNLPYPPPGGPETCLVR
ncbi:glycosyltransferase family 4 protein [Cupriavidus sp. USMAA2-4]|uniref:glycosyltransferase family 4 protein n=1 Tax=Cupriavidus sp. USMAA2-4 TaxID=876364 RepID=UPI0009FC9B90|nr:glycosyltransferase family 1 protein [Cupriavidus sp. USMAA2-4]